jgi:hypothetical protein
MSTETVLVLTPYLDSSVSTATLKSLTNVRGDLAERIGTTTEKNHVEALRGELARELETDTARRAGDKRPGGSAPGLELFDLSGAVSEGSGGSRRVVGLCEVHGSRWSDGKTHVGSREDRDLEEESEDGQGPSEKHRRANGGEDERLDREVDDCSWRLRLGRETGRLTELVAEDVEGGVDDRGARGGLEPVCVGDHLRGQRCKGNGHSLLQTSLQRPITRPRQSTTVPDSSSRIPHTLCLPLPRRLPAQSVPLNRSRRADIKLSPLHSPCTTLLQLPAMVDDTV